MSIEKDSSDNFYLNTSKLDENNRPVFFGAVQIKKNHVSYHLMPIYIKPSLIDGVSVGLKKRMQGKSCFNFKAVDTVLFDELRTLTQVSFNYYQERGYV